MYSLSLLFLTFTLILTSTLSTFSTAQHLLQTHYSLQSPLSINTSTSIPSSLNTVVYQHYPHHCESKPLLESNTLSSLSTFTPPSVGGYIVFFYSSDSSSSSLFTVRDENVPSPTPRILATGKQFQAGQTISFQATLDGQTGNSTLENDENDNKVEYFWTVIYINDEENTTLNKAVWGEGYRFSSSPNSTAAFGLVGSNGNLGRSSSVSFVAGKNQYCQSSGAVCDVRLQTGEYQVVVCVDDGFGLVTQDMSTMGLACSERYQFTVESNEAIDMEVRQTEGGKRIRRFSTRLQDRAIQQLDAQAQLDSVPSVGSRMEIYTAPLVVVLIGLILFLSTYMAVSL